MYSAHVRINKVEKEIENVKAREEEQRRALEARLEQDAEESARALASERRASNEKRDRKMKALEDQVQGPHSLDLCRPNLHTAPIFTLLFLLGLIPILTPPTSAASLAAVPVAPLLITYDNLPNTYLTPSSPLNSQLSALASIHKSNSDKHGNEVSAGGMLQTRAWPRTYHSPGKSRPNFYPDTPTPEPDPCPTQATHALHFLDYTFGTCSHIG